MAGKLNDSPKVLESLQKAFTSNPKLSYLAIHLSNCQKEASELTEARNTLETALGVNRTDMKLNYRYGLLLHEMGEPPEKVAYYLKRSFSPGDNNIDAQLRYNMALFQCGEFEVLKKELELLKATKSNHFIKDESPYQLPEGSQGSVNGLRHSHLFATENKSGISVLIPRREVNSEHWGRLSRGSSVQFSIRVTPKGLLGFGCSIA